MLSFGELRSLAQAKPTERRWQELMRLLDAAQGLTAARYEQELSPYLSAHLERWDAALCALPWRWIEQDQTAPWHRLARSLKLGGKAQVHTFAQYLERHPQAELGLTTLRIDETTRGAQAPSPEHVSAPELQRLKSLETLRVTGEDLSWLSRLVELAPRLRSLSVAHSSLEALEAHLREPLQRHQSVELITGGSFESLQSLEGWASEALTALSFRATPQHVEEIITGLPRLERLERLTLRSEAFHDANLLLISNDDGFTAPIRHLCLSHQFTSATSIQPILEGRVGLRLSALSSSPWRAAR